MSNTFGKIFKVTSFGESHGEGIGVVIDGCPAGFRISLEQIQLELDRRRPGQSRISTQRREPDRFKTLSGLHNGVTTGAPITFFIPNQDQKGADYEHLSSAFRPSHADFTYQTKYGVRDYKGGGRSSARITAGWVAAGALAKQLLEKEGIEIQAYVSQVGHLSLDRSYLELDLSQTELNSVRCPDAGMAKQMEDFIDQVRKERDTVGGVVSCVCTGVPPGLGEPVFDKLHAGLGKAMLSINAVKGFQVGSGFGSTAMRGSEHNDLFYSENNKIRTKTNHSGGIQGGISNGEDIYFDVAFKPVSTLMQTQPSVNELGEEIILEGKGRHDPCVVPRAVPIVEAMAALVLVDFLLLHKLSAKG